MSAVLEDGAVSVLAADGHPLTMIGLVDTITRDRRLTLIASVSDGSSALAMIRSARPTVAIVDSDLDDPDGCEIARSVRVDELATRVVVLSSARTGDLVLRCLAAGAAGILSTRAQPEAVIDAIVRVAGGESVLPGDIGATIASVLSDGDQHRAELTDRELEALRGIARGKSAVEIAEQLGLAVPTVKTHIQNVYLKLGVNDRGAAVAVAMRRGLLR